MTNKWLLTQDYVYKLLENSRDIDAAVSRQDYKCYRKRLIEIIALSKLMMEEFNELVGWDND